MHRIIIYVFKIKLMNYPGKELEIFDKATFWRKYVHILVKKYMKENILEVGAGIEVYK